MPVLDKGKAWPAVQLSAIQTGSLYARMGLRSGDLVYAIDGHSLYSFDSLVNVVADPSMAKDLDEPQPVVNGDRLHTIAGVEVATPEAVFVQLGRLVELPSSSIVLTRRGATVTLTYSVQ